MSKTKVNDICQVQCLNANNNDNKTQLNSLVEQVVKKIGVNILLLREIEKGLKIIIPFLSDSEANEKTADDIRKEKEKIKSKTLGFLVKRFLESCQYEPDNFSDYLMKIVEERNKLVHCLDSNLLNTEDSCRRCLKELEEQRREAFSFYKDLKLYALGLMWMLKQQSGNTNPEIILQYETAKKNIKHIIGDTEYINELDPYDTFWENTKIVKLLRLAELKIEKTHGMTLLSKAGKFIKNQAPECDPKRYGIKTLKNILKVSGLFEIIEPEKGVILYQSKV